jgi:hypothetical protein
LFVKAYSYIMTLDNILKVVIFLLRSHKNMTIRKERD